MTMRRIGISQRVVQHPDYDERRDVLDQRWSCFVEELGMLPVAIPNRITNIGQFADQLSLEGFVLTGGNDLADFGGDAPERDHLERQIIQLSDQTGRPIVGVCRGMQVLQTYYGGKLSQVNGHVACRHSIRTHSGESREVNSFHNYAVETPAPELKVEALADDGIVEAVKHLTRPYWGIMWHPERETPFDSLDLDFFSNIFDDQ